MIFINGVDNVIDKLIIVIEDFFILNLIYSQSWLAAIAYDQSVVWNNINNSIRFVSF